MYVSHTDVLHATTQAIKRSTGVALEMNLLKCYIIYTP